MKSMLTTSAASCLIRISLPSAGSLKADEHERSGARLRTIKNVSKSTQNTPAGPDLARGYGHDRNAATDQDRRHGHHGQDAVQRLAQ